MRPLPLILGLSGMSLIFGCGHSYSSRLTVAISWLWSFLSGGHSARLITQRETLRPVDQSLLHEPPPAAA